MEGRYMLWSLEAKKRTIIKSFSDGAHKGEKPSGGSIMSGTVQMEYHPEYEKFMDLASSEGFQISYVRSTPYVALEKYRWKDQRLEIVRKLAVVPSMRFLDLEHELDHVDQLLTRFIGQGLFIFTAQFKEGRSGKPYLDDQSPDTLTKWQCTVTEYHARLKEFIRLSQRNVSLTLILEAAQSVEWWAMEYWKRGLKKGYSESRINWVQQHFYDLIDLERSYQTKIQELGWVEAP